MDKFNATIKTYQYPSNNNRHKIVQERWRSHAKRNKITHSFCPVYYFSRIFGLMPFTVAHGTNESIRKPEVRLVDGVWFGVSICFYIALAILILKSVKLPDSAHKPSYILMLGDYLQLIVGLIYASLIIIFDMCNRCKLVGILNKFIIFDHEVMLYCFM